MENKWDFYFTSNIHNTILIFYSLIQPIFNEFLLKQKIVINTLVCNFITVWLYIGVRARKGKNNRKCIIYITDLRKFLRRYCLCWDGKEERRDKARGVLGKRTSSDCVGSEGELLTCGRSWERRPRPPGWRGLEREQIIGHVKALDLCLKALAYVIQNKKKNLML